MYEYNSKNETMSNVIDIVKEAEDTVRNIDILLQSTLTVPDNAIKLTTVGTKEEKKDAEAVEAVEAEELESDIEEIKNDIELSDRLDSIGKSGRVNEVDTQKKNSASIVIHMTPAKSVQQLITTQTYSSLNLRHCKNCKKRYDKLKSKYNKCQCLYYCDNCISGFQLFECRQCGESYLPYYVINCCKSKKEICF